MAHFLPLRRFPRYALHTPVSVRLRGRWHSARLHGTVENIGEGGLCASLDGSLELGDAAMVRVAVPHCSVTLHLRAEVRYRNGDRHGFEFREMSALQQSEIRRCCRLIALHTA